MAQDQIVTIAPIREPITDPQTGKVSRVWTRYFGNTRIQTLPIPTATGLPSVNLANFAGVIVIKDSTGNAGGNPIQIIGTVDGAVNPTIAVNWGVLRLFSNGPSDWLSW